MYSADSKIHDVNSKNGEPYCKYIVLDNVNYIDWVLQTTHGVIIPPGKNGGDWTCKSKQKQSGSANYGSRQHVRSSSPKPRCAVVGQQSHEWLDYEAQDWFSGKHGGHA